MKPAKPSSRTRRCLSFALPGLLCLAGPVPAQEFAAAEQAAAAPEAVAIGDDSSSVIGDYQIGPNDTLNVHVIDFPEYSDTLTVRPDGKITTPLVEDMVAEGKTPTQLARDIEAVLAEFIRVPRVNISVETFFGVVGAQIRVMGQVAKPGRVPYRNGMTLLDVMLEAGGMTEFGSGRRATLSRTVDGEVVQTRIRLDRLLENGDLSENIAMKPGDIVHVPQAAF